MVVVDMSIKCLLCVERLVAELAGVDEHAGEVDGLHVDHHVVLLGVALTTHGASVERRKALLTSCDVL